MNILHYLNDKNFELPTNVQFYRIAPPAYRKPFSTSTYSSLIFTVLLLAFHTYIYTIINIHTLIQTQIFAFICIYSTERNKISLH